MTRREEVLIRSLSRAHDGALLAAADIADIASRLDVEYRLVGGNAVSLLTEIYGVADRVPARETADADLGVAYEVAADTRLLPSLEGRGYERVSGNRFMRTRRGPSGDPVDERRLVIDILTPSFTGRLISNQPRGDLVVDEVPGLAIALAREGVTVSADIHLITGERLASKLILPDPVAALCLKAYAYHGRLAGRDALDIWRLLEVALAAGVTASSWSDSGSQGDARQLIRRYFASPGCPGPTSASSRSGDQTRVRALAAQILGHLT